MNNTKKIRSIYSKIQDQLFYMIPEKWDKICLYASITEKVNNLKSGEMFFYYYPMGFIRKNPVNVYEVPNKFNIDEDEYMKLVDKLYKTINELRNECRNSNEPLWSNLTIVIEDTNFQVDYSYDDLLNSKYSDKERHLIWKCNYLNYPIERLSRRERKLYKEYVFEKDLEKNQTSTYSEGIYRRNYYNTVGYNTEENFLKYDIDENIESSENKAANIRLNGEENYKLYQFDRKKEKENIDKAQMKNQILNF